MPRDYYLVVVHVEGGKGKMGAHACRASTCAYGRTIQHRGAQIVFALETDGKISKLWIFSGSLSLTDSLADRVSRLSPTSLFTATRPANANYAQLRDVASLPAVGKRPRYTMQKKKSRSRQKNRRHAISSYPSIMAHQPRFITRICNSSS